MGMYVIQTMSGKEKYVIDLINSYIGQPMIEECFVLKSEVKRHHQGEWKMHLTNLLPGYIFVKTKQVGKVCDALKKVPAFTKLLGNNDVFIPLSANELEWLGSFTTPKDRTSHFSVGIIEGDRVVVQSGPLKGYETLISKIDRHKRIAYIDVTVMGRAKRVQVGLEIVSKK